MRRFGNLRKAWQYIGRLERNYHNAAGVEKFNHMVESGYLRIVFRKEGVTISNSSVRRRGRSMPTLVVEPDLYKRVEKAALEHEASIDEILSKAVRHYLWELDRRKISEETRIYRQRHAELQAQHLGQYIAMRNGQVVDHDADFQTLYQRIRQRFGRTPVMITLVEKAAERTLVRHGFRMERASL